MTCLLFNHKRESNPSKLFKDARAFGLVWEHNAHYKLLLYVRAATTVNCQYYKFLQPSELHRLVTIEQSNGRYWMCLVYCLALLTHTIQFYAFNRGGKEPSATALQGAMHSKELVVKHGNAYWLASMLAYCFWRFVSRDTERLNESSIQATYALQENT